MANATRNAILRALIEGVLTDLMVKTNATNVYVDDSTTLAAKLAEIITSLNNKATPASVTEAINALRSEMLGDTPVEAYNTFTELANYIETHADAADALSAAISNKADKTAFETLQSKVGTIESSVNGLGSLANKSFVAESDLDSTLKEKVNAAAQGNHSHANKTLLDGITSENVVSWNNKARVLVDTARPSDLTENDLWIQLI